jgi:hypothetical protein
MYWSHLNFGHNFKKCVADMCIKTLSTPLTLYIQAATSLEGDAVLPHTGIKYIEKVLKTEEKHSKNVH